MSKIVRSIRATQVGILTDFGTRSPYASEVKCAILKDIGALEVELVEITHSIEQHNVREGAYVLYAASRSFAEGAILLGIVDPEVGTERKALIVRSDIRTYVGPDNGLLIPSAKADGSFKAFEISDHIAAGGSISEVFHGRDVFAKAVNFLVKCERVEELGRPVDEYVDLSLFNYVACGNQLRGTVLFTDDFGNVTTNIPASEAGAAEDIDFEVSSRAGQFDSKFVRSYGFVEPGDLLVTVGSQGLLELAVNKGSARQMLHAGVGDEISLRLSSS